MLLPEGISTRSFFLWHQISDLDPFNLNATAELHLPENFHSKFTPSPTRAGLWHAKEKHGKI